MPRYLHNERFFAEHRAEDTVVIADVIREAHPRFVVELGTYQGGLAALFAETIAPWGGMVLSFDIERQFPPDLLEAHPNIRFFQEDVLTLNRGVLAAVGLQNVVLYTDNGAKQKEILTYAPYLHVGNVLGTHDWITEVDPAVVEPFLQRHGYERHRWAEFEALANPGSYPISMTRFWKRTHAGK